MYKINFDDEKLLFNYLKNSETKHHKRQKVINNILEINDEDDETLNYWVFTYTNNNLGQIFDQKFDKYTYFTHISHSIEKIEKINGEYFAKIKILNTYYGKILLDLINAEMKFNLECVYHTYV